MSLQSKSNETGQVMRATVAAGLEVKLHGVLAEEVGR